MIVVDASAILEFLLGGARSGRVASRLFAAGESLHAPHLLDLEVAQVLRRSFLSGYMTESRAGEALEDLSGMRIRRYPHFVLLPRIWELRHNISAYDAAYVALAERLGGALATCDAALAATRGHSAAIELL
ncbi:MAG: type II toxin-antitoxin system VapC family toxin [Bryobacteraceae bacterium]